VLDRARATIQDVRQPGRPRRFLGVALLVGVLASCGGLVYFSFKPLNGIWVRRLEADLNKRLPDRSTWEEAQAWFASHGLRPFTIRDLHGRTIGLGVMIPHNTLLDTADIQIYVYFDEQGYVRERIVRRGGFFPW
jgi:hypothetical protein